MTQLTLLPAPQQSTKLLLQKLPSRRMRDVLEKRFGLKGGKRKTLEAVGQEYKITRERVRQIEAEALKHMAKQEHLAEVQPTLTALHEHLNRHGGVMAERQLFSMVPHGAVPHVAFLLRVGNGFHNAQETEAHESRWATNKSHIDAGEKILGRVVSHLEKEKVPVSLQSLRELVSQSGRAVLGKEPESHVVESILATSRLIRQNPYNEYGLASWAVINPRGVREKSYLVLAKKGSPLHFREVAIAIDKAGWSKRKAHPQTVHNELIKDKRFVLVGRGMYALKEWGYEPGVVKDVLISVLKRAGKPVDKDQLIKLVAEKRFVKPQTILLNLQNKSLFKKTNEGYTLA